MDKQQLNKVNAAVLMFFVLSSCYSSKKNYNEGIDNKNDFNITTRLKFKGKDTLIGNNYESGQVKEMGKYAFDNTNKLSKLKIGETTEFYENGRSKSKGSFLISSYIGCGGAGFFKHFYNIKIGRWIYYYSNGKKKAEGKYEIRKIHINTSCESGDYMNFGITNSSWKFYKEDGSIFVNTDSDNLAEFENIIDEYSNNLYLFHYDRSESKIELLERFIKDNQK